MREIESGEASVMLEQNSAALLAELNGKRRMLSTWPFALVLTFLALVLAILYPQRPWIVLAIPLAGVTMLAAWWDRNRKTTVLFYDLQPPVLCAFEALHTAFSRLATCRGTRLIEAKGRSLDVKYTAGADRTVRCRTVELADKAPPYVKTNIPVPFLPVGRQRLYLLPDRMLVYDDRGIGAVAYEGLDLSVTSQKYVEVERLPSDAEVVDWTWRYVNKSGGPDRRFRDNPEFPVALYDELAIRSASGLNEMLQLSRRGVAQEFISSVERLACALAESATQDGAQRTGLQAETDLESTPNVGSSAAYAESSPVGNARVLYYFDDGVRGPFSLAELATLSQRGVITMGTQVCAEGDTGWIAYQELVDRRRRG